MVQVMITIKTFLNECSEKAKKYPYILIGLVILLAAISLIWLPYWRVSQFGINNATENATLENQYRATIAQILGGIAIGISLYYTWQKNNIAQDGQITDRFTKAVDQLGNRKIEIRLGGIYALERIANESKKDYWQIIEILTAYVRENSIIDSHSELNSLRNVPISMDIQANESTIHEVPKIRTISLDIQAILTVIVRRKYSYEHGETNKLDFKGTNLQHTNLSAADLSKTNLSGADISGALLYKTNLYGANLYGADISGTLLYQTNLYGANLYGAGFFMSNLTEANLYGAKLSGAGFFMSNLTKANLYGAKLSGAGFFMSNLTEANLYGAKLERANITIDQLSTVKTLYDATLDPELEKPLREKYPALFEEPKK